MKLSALLPALLVSLSVSLPAAAQQLPARAVADRRVSAVAADNKVVFIDAHSPSDSLRAHMVDSIRSVISEFYYDQFRHFQDPDAPYFLFMSKDAQLAMGIGGCVRMRLYYDWGGAVPAAGFAPYLIPMTPDPTDMRSFNTTPAGSSLFFRVIGRNRTVGLYQLYIEANFNGYKGRDFHLKKAFAMVNDWTVGYAPSTFSDPSALPPTVDAQGPSNKISHTSVLVRWMRTFRRRYVVALSAETPATAIAADAAHTAEISNWMPDWAAFFQYQWARGQHVRLAGIVRTLGYRDLLTGVNHDRAGWGLQLSSVSHPAAPLTLYTTLAYGHGFSSLGGDLAIGKYDLVATPGDAGRLYAPASMGWCVGLQYHFRPNLFASVSASQTYYMPAHTAAPSEYKNGLFANVNVFWNLTPRMQVAAEFDLGRRQNVDGATRWARRIGALAQFSF